MPPTKKMSVFNNKIVDQGKKLSHLSILCLLCIDQSLQPPKAKHKRNQQTNKHTNKQIKEDKRRSMRHFFVYMQTYSDKLEINEHKAKFRV